MNLHICISGRENRLYVILGKIRLNASKYFRNTFKRAIAVKFLYWTILCKYYEIFKLDIVCFWTEDDSAERSFNCELFEFELEPIKNSWVRKFVANGLFVCFTQNKKLLLINGMGSVLFGNKFGGLLCSQTSNRFGAFESAFSRSSSFFATSGKLVLLEWPPFLAVCQTLFCLISNAFCRPP